MNKHSELEIQSTQECLALFHRKAELTDGAAPDEIAAAEKELGVSFPLELIGLLKKSNGVKTRSGKSLIWSTSELVAKNKFYWTNPQFNQQYMPLKHLLFFSDVWDVVLFCYPIFQKACDERSWIFYWNKENDARDYAKFNLAELALELINPGRIFTSRVKSEGWSTNDLSIETLKPIITRHWKSFPPAAEKEILRLESQLGKTIPESLREFYLFSNGVDSGIGFEIFPVHELIARNASIKSRYHELETVMPAESFLFIALAGNGDIFGFPITGAGIGSTIFALYLETDGRSHFANDLYSLLDCQLDEFKEDDDPLDDLNDAQLEALGLERVEEGSQKSFYIAFQNLRNTGLELYYALPQTLLEQHPGLFKAKEIHSLKYLSGIPETVRQNEKYVHHLITESWKGFLKSHQKPTREEVLKHMRSIDRAYEQYFVPALNEAAR